MDPEIIAGAVNAAIAYFKSASQMSWQDQVSDQLKTIIQKLEDIQAFLNTIPNLLATALDNQTRKVMDSEMQGYVNAINDLIAEHPKGPGANPALIGVWSSALTNLDTALSQNENYSLWGFAQFAVVATGISAAAGLAKFEKTVNTFPKLLGRAVGYFKDAVNSSVGGSFASANQTLRNQAAQLVNQVDNGLLNRPWATGYASSYQPPHGPPHSIYQTMTFHGSLESGINLQPDYGHGAPVFMPGTRNELGSEADAVNLLRSYQDQYAALQAAISNSQKCIDACEAIIGQLTGVHVAGAHTSSLSAVS